MRIVRRVGRKVGEVGSEVEGEAEEGEVVAAVEEEAMWRDLLMTRIRRMRGIERRRIRAVERIITGETSGRERWRGLAFLVR